jgi:hypothetical protein
VEKIVNVWSHHNELMFWSNQDGKYTPVAFSAQEYEEKVRQRFCEPFFIHSRKFGFTGSKDGHAEFYIIGEKEHTSNFMGLLLEEPASIKSLLSELTGVEEGPLRGYSVRNNLVVFDTTRKPKKQIKRINWGVS